jgi:nicotinamide-nucleotide amidase
MLGLAAATLETYGAVSEETAREMADGALRYSHAQVTVAVSGIAGPAGGTQAKPVGSVCLAWARLGKETHSQIRHFSGGRTTIRQLAVSAALQGLLDFLIKTEAT